MHRRKECGGAHFARQTVIVDVLRARPKHDAIQRIATTCEPRDVALTRLTDGSGRCVVDTASAMSRNDGRGRPSTLIMKPAWSIYAWPPVLWQADRAAELHFLHLGTRVLNTGHRMFPSSGQTLW